jgi:hypothetical protein
MFLIGTASPIALAQQAKKPFTVADEIGLTLFGDLEGGTPEVHFSADGSYFAVWAERGRLDLNCPQDSLRFYDSRAVENFLEHSNERQPPSPRWIVTLSTNKEGRIIDDWRWLGDSSGVAFRERATGGKQRLVLADLREKTLEPLTSAMETIGVFDIRDRQHYVYTVVSAAEREKMQAERQAPMLVGTGHKLSQLLLPDDPRTIRGLSSRGHLWAVVGHKRFEIKHAGVALVPEGNLVLSPDGLSVATTLLVPEFPQSWETLYPPPYASSPYRLQVGKPVHQYVRIDLQSGSIGALTDAPTSNDAGWWAGDTPHWSSDGQEILLPGTFLDSKDHKPSRPCVAVVDVTSNTRTCVEMIKGHTETGVEENYHAIRNAQFAEGDKHRVIVSFIDHWDQSIKATEYRRTADGTWQEVAQIKGEPKLEHNGFEVTVEQGFNEPPLLVVKRKQSSRVIWDPNPQLKTIDLGQASVYKWTDKEGRLWRGGLFKPNNYEPGRSYPLVIQTHGFAEAEFRPSGVFPTAFAARALAAVGIAVLQVGGGDCPIATLDEGPCAVSGYEAATNQLVSEGLVDPEKIGIIGFSRTCFYVMEALTTGSLRLKAASITDGVMEDYLQYMMFDVGANEANSMIGAKPFGEGLQQWFRRSPGFNLNKVTAPLLVVGNGPLSLLGMWEPYAGLRYLQKPVDLIMLNTDEHVLTNPVVRMASQGGSVDWFCFWLKDEEDPDPSKAEQYIRWHQLRKLQEANVQAK